MRQNETDRAREALRLEEDIGRLEGELDDRYRELGREISEAADRRITEINRLVDRLVESKLRLARARGEVTCPRCLALNAPTHRFCAGCGAALSPDGAKPPFDAQEKESVP